MTDHTINPEYPSQACSGCCEKARKKQAGKEVFIYHLGKCVVCGKETAITDTKNFGYPNFAIIEDD